ncbi:PREDICTED: uncharacterized protein LOC105567930 [Vollenhovia emeryi]|uniref:uncharacterized protein LOC105567930 n=1 Tax=Vollenhovia emeryi TaxID=411798 RepID=UPI0005F3FB0C|nr:PREDICTED: uncharacterized protein LOC105567930 [Vollenhovia emeryi]
MIKLFLITLLCVAVLADSPADKFNQIKQAGRNMSDMAEQVMTGHGSRLVQRDAPQQQPPRGPPPRGGPPQN